MVDSGANIYLTHHDPSPGAGLGRPRKKRNRGGPRGRPRLRGRGSWLRSPTITREGGIIHPHETPDKKREKKCAPEDTKEYPTATTRTGLDSTPSNNITPESTPNF